MNKLLLFLACLLPLLGWAQADTTALENYDDYGDTETTRRFATQKVRLLSPTKLITLGYEAQLPFDISTAGPPGGSGRVNALQGLRVAFNAPVISRTNLIVNLGLSYWESNAAFAGTPTHPLYRNLGERGLRTTGFQATVFKPLNEKHFLVFSGNADLNGNYRWGDLRAGLLGRMTYSAAALFGWKKTDNYQLAVGLSRTYRFAEVAYVPVLLFNKTFNDRWGVEALLPARAAVRRTFSAQSLLTFGYELEGNSYLMQGLLLDGPGVGPTPYDNLRLRRSELKVRLTYERALVGFLWVSVQGGLRFNARNRLTVSEGDRAVLLTNTLGNPLYFNVSLNLVSP